MTQRERIIEAMVVVAARYGYREASVARVIAQAGVSRATFYEQFANKDACFLAAYRKVAARVEGGMEALGLGQEGPGVSPREVLARVLETADREPAGARILLLEGLAGDAEVRTEHERLLDLLEQALDVYLDRTPVDGMRLEIPARSLLGAIGSVIAIRVFRGEAGRLADLGDDLNVWMRSYAVAGGRRDHGDWARLGSALAVPVEPAPSPLDQRLPRGRAALSPAVVASEQRQRLLAAVARLVRQKGYVRTTVADVVATAGVAREAFYEQFRSKEDVFLAAQAYALETSLSLAAEKFFAAETWPDRIWNSLIALLRYFSSVPDLASLDVVESYAAGAAAIRRSFESRMAFTLFLEEGFQQRPEAERLPRLCLEAIAGAVLEPMRRQTATGQAARSLGLVPQIAYVAMAPFVEPGEAVRLVEERCTTARP